MKNFFSGASLKDSREFMLKDRPWMKFAGAIATLAISEILSGTCLVVVDNGFRAAQLRQ